MNADVRTNANRFRTHAYGCASGCFQVGTLEGWATFHDIFAQRPNECRYAIVEDVAGRFHVWDFYADDLVRAKFESIPPFPVWSGPTQEAAEMWVIHRG